MTGSSPSGTTVGTDQIQVTLASEAHGTGYNFNAKGLQPAMISARLFLASAPPLVQMVRGMHTAPTVSLSGGSGTTFSTTYQAGGSAVAIASSGATITSPGSETLTGLTVTLTNLKDGSSEVLAATTTGTPITSTYANGVLRLSGVANVSAYQTVLQSITYKNNASSPQVGARTITVVANDGTASSKAATATVTVQAASSSSAAARNSAGPDHELAPRRARRAVSTLKPDAGEANDRPTIGRGLSQFSRAPRRSRG